MSGPALQIEALHKRYGALSVTDGVSLTLNPGELHAIIGPNGAGKTTLIGQIAGTVSPDAGAIRLNGRDITRMRPPARVRAGLARSFQITTILPRFTVLENVALAIQARSGSSFRFWRPAAGEGALNEPALALIDRFGLLARAATEAGSVSHGERRQLELAVALATGPDVLLLDEPLAGTSHEEAQRIIATLRALKGSVAMLLVEHDMEAVFALADRISVLVYGRIVATGVPAAIRADPAVRAAYLGEEFS